MSVSISHPMVTTGNADLDAFMQYYIKFMNDLAAKVEVLSQLVASTQCQMQGAFCNCTGNSASVDT